jgi:hypothetical protein
MRRPRQFAMDSLRQSFARERREFRVGFSQATTSQESPELTATHKHDNSTYVAAEETGCDSFLTREGVLACFRRLLLLRLRLGSFLYEGVPELKVHRPDIGGKTRTGGCCNLKTSLHTLCGSLEKPPHTSPHFACDSPVTRPLKFLDFRRKTHSTCSYTAQQCRA